MKLKKRNTIIRTVESFCTCSYCSCSCGSNPLSERLTGNTNSAGNTNITNHVGSK